MWNVIFGVIFHAGHDAIVLIIKKNDYHYHHHHRCHKYYHHHEKSSGWPPGVRCRGAWVGHHHQTCLACNNISNHHQHHHRYSSSSLLSLSDLSSLTTFGPHRYHLCWTQWKSQKCGCEWVVAHHHSKSYKWSVLWMLSEWSHRVCLEYAKSVPMVCPECTQSHSAECARSVLWAALIM